MKYRRARSGALFLMEIILAILFFSVAASVCVSILVNARLLSRNAQCLNTAVTVCSTAAETVDSAQNFDDVKVRVSLIFPDGAWDGDDFSAVIYGASSDTEDPFGALKISLTPETEQTLFRADIMLLQEDDEDALYEICVERHFPLER